MRVSIDNSRWPLSVQTLGADMSNQEYDSFLQALNSVLERRQRYAYILHLETLSMDAIRRKKMADMLAVQAPLIKQFCLGGGIITNSRVSAAFVTAIRWVIPPPHPEKVFHAPGPAYTFAEQLLALAGLRAGGSAGGFPASSAL